MDASDLETASCSDIGERDEQQDRIAVFKRCGAHLLVLADGMGGHSGGAVAAQALVDVAAADFPGPVHNPAELLTEIALHAHHRVNAIGAERSLSPHTTCVLLYIDDKTQGWAHVGDSRLYRFDHGRLIERTIDHSIVELLRLQGKVRERDMNTHPDQSRLYEAIGGSETPAVQTGGKEVSPADGFLLASDGLWEHVGERDLERVFGAPDMSAALAALVEKARVAGGAGADNISAIAARYQCAPGGVGRLVRVVRNLLAGNASRSATRASDG